MLGITRDGSFISHNHQSAKIYSCVSSQIVPQNCCHCIPHCGIRPKFRSVVWQYFFFPSVSLLAVLQQDLCLHEKFLERVFDKGLTPHSVCRKVNFRMLMIAADDLGLGTNSACFPVLVTLRDTPIAPYLKVRMVNFKVFSAYSGHSWIHKSPVLTRGRYDKIFNITQLELRVHFWRLPNSSCVRLFKVPYVNEFPLQRNMRPSKKLSVASDRLTVTIWHGF